MAEPLYGSKLRMLYRLKHACTCHLSILVSIHRPCTYINLLSQHHVFQISASFTQMPIHRRTCYTCGKHCSRLANKIYRCGRCLYVRKPFIFLFSANIILVSPNTVHESVRGRCGPFTSATVKYHDSVPYLSRSCTPRQGSG